MLGFAQDRSVSADHGVRIDEVRGIQGGAACFALVTIRPFVLAMRASANDVTVGQELLGFLVVVLFRGFLDEFALFIEIQEEIRGHLMVRF